MYPHHVKAAENLADLFKDKPETLAVIWGGSVVKGMERPDSDIDGMIVVTGREYDRLHAGNRAAYVLPMEKDPYKGGYYDLKFLTLGHLEQTLEKGSEPARHAYYKAKILFSREPRVDELVEKLNRYPQEGKQEKINIFHAGYSMSKDYLWACAVQENNLYLKYKTACDIVLFGIRMLFVKNDIFFPCHRNLLAYCKLLMDKPEGIEGLAETFLREITEETKEAFTGAIDAFADWKFDDEAVCSYYMEYFEKWWLHGHPNVYEM